MHKCSFICQKRKSEITVIFIIEKPGLLWLGMLANISKDLPPNPD